MADTLANRRARTFFRRFDGNKDGILTREDFATKADNSCEFENPDSGRRKTVDEKYTKYFDSYYEHVGKDGKINEEEWVEAFKKVRVDPKFKALMRDIAYISFNLQDLDGNGYIDEDEYARMFRYLQINDNKEHAKIGFNAFDVNGDGKITFEEYKQRLLEFFFSDDEQDAGILFFGDLVEDSPAS